MQHWFDIGINLPDKRLPEAQIFEAAQQQDVLGCVLIGTDTHQSRQAQQIATQYNDWTIATAGVHPHNAAAVEADYLEQLTQLSQLPKVRALGECGLDFNRNFSAPQDQIRVFEQQLQLACELQLPVYLHERDAFDTQLQLLTRYADKLNGAVVHCFTGTPAQMQAYLELGFYIGVTGWVCDPKRGESLRAAVKQLPVDRLLLETDAPYLFPKTLKPRASTNQPAYLPHIGESVANLMNMDVLALQQQVWQNSLTFFSLESSRAA